MRKIIIVCDEKRREFADYLSQLVSLSDDTEDGTVGVKDGAVATQVWPEKHYEANAATVSSDQYILFIGKSKLVKEKSSHMKTVFEGHGIKYGWLGKQAFLNIEKAVPFDKYDDFIEFAQNYESDIKKLVEKKDNSKVAAAGVAGAGVAGAAIGGKALVAFVAPIALAPIIGVGVAIPLSKRIKLKSEIERQMYSCATMKFYLDDMSKFLGI